MALTPGAWLGAYDEVLAPLNHPNIAAIIEQLGRHELSRLAALHLAARILPVLRK